MSNDLTEFSATQMLSHFRNGSLSPVEVTRAALERIDELNGRLNAFRFVAYEEALKAASASEDRWRRNEPMGLLDGVPTSIKDSHPVKGWSTLYGSKTVSESGPWATDALHVARLREHGAVFLGKTTLCEFAWKCVGDSPLTGISRNPWDPDKTCGASSAGAAIAASAGMGAIHMGGDGGGSIRAPASFCGVYGIKGTYGRVPSAPAESFITCSHFGPITRTVTDAALAMTVITMPDFRDVFSVPYDQRDYRIGLDDGVKGLRIAFSPELGSSQFTTDPEIAEIVSDAVSVFEELGAKVEEIQPVLGNTLEAYKIMNSAYQAPKIQDKTEEQIASMDQTLVANARIGEKISASQLLQAGKVRADWAYKMAELHQSFDLLVTPTLPVTAFDVGHNNPPSWEDRLSEEDKLYCQFNNFLYPFNYTHQPAANVPCGFSEDGLPIGLQIVGPRFNDHQVLVASRAFEAVRPFRMFK